MTFYIPRGEHQIAVQFGETKLRKVANLVSLFGLGVLIPFRFMLKLPKK